jgi:hypothetical protein
MLRDQFAGHAELEAKCSMMHSEPTNCFCMYHPHGDRRSLQTLASSLGGLLSERRWQQGSYSSDVLPALVGDAWLSGALGLADWDTTQEEAAAAGAGGRQRTFGAAAAAQRWVAYAFPAAASLWPCFCVLPGGKPHSRPR